jgi:hypothetical protein
LADVEKQAERWDESMKTLAGNKPESRMDELMAGGMGLTFE